MQVLDRPEVALVEALAKDISVVQAARVSVVGENAPAAITAEGRNKGLINHLMRHRHGTPFEHNMMKFYVKAPIFVFREFQRHRIGISYNEMSGRYRELPGVFYLPAEDRPIVQVGKNADYELVPGTAEQYLEMIKDHMEAFLFCWEKYKKQLADGIAKEVARNVLPVGIFSEMYVTCNARSLMSFLSLRVYSDDAMFETKPLYEINRVADELEKHFSMLMPLTHAAFVNNKRVAP